MADATGGSNPESDPVPGIDLTGDEYHVTQSVIRNKYRVDDAAGRTLLRGKQKMFKMKEEFPFVDADDEPVMTVKAGGILDVAGDYTLTDERTEEPIVILDKKFTFFKHEWRIRDPESERLLATIESNSTAVEVLRNFSSIASLIPHTYTIEDADGNDIGSIEGQFSIRDKYVLHIGDTGEVPREAIVAAAIAVDALEGN